MRSCAGCGGAIGEPGVAYGYAGKWCHCVRPVPNDYPHVQGFADIKTKLGGLNPAPGPIIALPLEKPETLTPAEFVHWLRGYVAAQGENAPKHLADQLRKVRT